MRFYWCELKGARFTGKENSYSVVKWFNITCMGAQLIRANARICARRAWSWVLVPTVG